VKWLIAGVLVLLLSVSLALVALPDPGYVLIGYGNYSIETSGLVLLVVLVLLYIAIRLVAGALHAPSRVMRWDQRRRHRRMNRLYNKAVIELAEGRPERAERYLLRIVHAGDAPLALQFSVARLVSRTGDDERASAFLKLARQQHPQAELAISLLEAELLLANGRLEQAQTILAQARGVAPRNPVLLRLLVQLYTQQGDRVQLQELLPELKRGKVLEQAQWQALVTQVWREAVPGSGADADSEGIQQSWQALPASVRDDEQLIGEYASRLMKAGDHAEAGKVLTTALNRYWNPRLVYLFGELEGGDPASRQQTAERWLKKHEDDAMLLLTLGKLSQANQLWGKARSYLEASTGLHSTPEAWRLLGVLLEQLDEPQQATECYRRGLESAECQTGLALPVVQPPAPHAALSGSMIV